MNEDFVIKSREIIENKGKKEIKELIKYNGKDKKVVIPEGIATISQGAFENSKELESIRSVEIPSSIEKIGFGVFGRCEFLEEIILLASLSKNEKKLFAYNKDVINKIKYV